MERQVRPIYPSMFTHRHTTAVMAGQGKKQHGSTKKKTEIKKKIYRGELRKKNCEIKGNCGTETSKLKFKITAVAGPTQQQHVVELRQPGGILDASSPLTSPDNLCASQQPISINDSVDKSYFEFLDYRMLIFHYTPLPLSPLL